MWSMFSCVHSVQYYTKSTGANRPGQQATPTFVLYLPVVAWAHFRFLLVNWPPAHVRLSTRTGLRALPLNGHRRGEPLLPVVGFARLPALTVGSTLPLDDKARSISSGLITPIYFRSVPDWDALPSGLMRPTPQRSTTF